MRSASKQKFELRHWHSLYSRFDIISRPVGIRAALDSFYFFLSYIFPSKIVISEVRAALQKICLLASFHKIIISHDVNRPPKDMTFLFSHFAARD